MQKTPSRTMGKLLFGSVSLLTLLLSSEAVRAVGWTDSGGAMVPADGAPPITAGASGDVTATQDNPSLLIINGGITLLQAGKSLDFVNRNGITVQVDPGGSINGSGIKASAGGTGTITNAGAISTINTPGSPITNNAGGTITTINAAGGITNAGGTIGTIAAAGSTVTNAGGTITTINAAGALVTISGGTAAASKISTVGAVTNSGALTFDTIAPGTYGKGQTGQNILNITGGTYNPASTTIGYGGFLNFTNDTTANNAINSDGQAGALAGMVGVSNNKTLTLGANVGATQALGSVVVGDILTQASGGILNTNGKTINAAQILLYDRSPATGGTESALLKIDAPAACGIFPGGGNNTGVVQVTNTIAPTITPAGKSIGTLPLPGAPGAINTFFVSNGKTAKLGSDLMAYNIVLEDGVGQTTLETAPAALPLTIAGTLGVKGNATKDTRFVVNSHVTIVPLAKAGVVPGVNPSFGDGNTITFPSATTLGGGNLIDAATTAFPVNDITIATKNGYLGLNSDVYAGNGGITVSDGGVLQFLAPLGGIAKVVLGNGMAARHLEIQDGTLSVGPNAVTVTHNTALGVGPSNVKLGSPAFGGGRFHVTVSGPGGPSVAAASDPSPVTSGGVISPVPEITSGSTVLVSVNPAVPTLPAGTYYYRIVKGTDETNPAGNATLVNATLENITTPSPATQAVIPVVTGMPVPVYQASLSPVTLSLTRDKYNLILGLTIAGGGGAVPGPMGGFDLQGGLTPPPGLVCPPGMTCTPSTPITGQIPSGGGYNPGTGEGLAKVAGFMRNYLNDSESPSARQYSPMYIALTTRAKDVADANNVAVAPPITQAGASTAVKVIRLFKPRQQNHTSAASHHGPAPAGGGGHHADAGVAMAAGSEPGEKTGFEPWVRLLGERENQRKRKDYLGYLSNTFALGVGIDSVVGEGSHKPGLSFTVSRTVSHEKASPARTVIEGKVVSFYGSATPSRTWFLDGSLGMGPMHFNSTRFDATGVMYTADYKGTMINGTLSLGHKIKPIPGISSHFSISPYFTNEWSVTKTDAYTETGGPFPLSMPSNMIKSCHVGGGVRISSKSKKESMVLHPQVSLSYMRDLNPRARTVNATWVGQSMPLSGSPAARDIYGVEVAMASHSHDSGINTLLTYIGTFKASYASHSMYLKLSHKF